MYCRYERSYCKLNNIEFSQRRLYRWYSMQTDIKMADIDKMVEKLGDQETNLFLKNKLKELRIEKLRWT
jgi:hypothetical protein